MRPEPGPAATERVCTFPLGPKDVDGGWPVVGFSPNGPWAARVRAKYEVAGEIVVGRRNEAPVAWARIERGRSRIEGWVRPDTLRLTPTRLIGLSETIYLTDNARAVVFDARGEHLSIEIPTPHELTTSGPLRAEVTCSDLTAGPSIAADSELRALASKNSKGQILRTGVPVVVRPTPDAEGSVTLTLDEGDSTYRPTFIVERGPKRSRVRIGLPRHGLTIVGWVDNDLVQESTVGLGLIGAGRPQPLPFHASCVDPVSVVAEVDGQRWQLGSVQGSELLEASDADLRAASVRGEWFHPLDDARLELATRPRAGCQTRAR
jgi:hypothetical protein